MPSRNKTINYYFGYDNFLEVPTFKETNLTSAVYLSGLKYTS